jgi:hypothetical protein
MLTNGSDQETRPTPPMPLPLRPGRARLTNLGIIAAVALITLLAGTLFALHRAPAPRATPFVHVVSTSRQVLAGDATPTVATCPAGELALSGGWAVPAAGSVLASQRMGNGWGIVVQVPAGPSASVTARVACLAHVPSATVRQLSSSVTTANGPFTISHVDCPASVSGAVGGGFATSSSQLTFAYFFLDMGSTTTWVMQDTHSGPGAATSTVLVECFTAPGVTFTGVGRYDTTIPQGGEQTITAVCPQGFFAGGGGVTLGPSSPGYPPHDVHLLSLAPATTARGWSADLSPVGGDTTVDVYVTCLRFF